MITDQEIIFRIIIGALLGAMVGFERERQGQPAGLRTHIILVVGATLAMTLSINMAIQFNPLVPNGDPARLAAQVISGIGFLGAGAILRYGSNIKGLTTATSLWTMAIVGLAIGAGHYLSGFAATTIILIALILLNVFEKHYIKTYTMMVLDVSADDKATLPDEIRKTLHSIVSSMEATSIDKNLATNQIRLTYTIKLTAKTSIQNITENLEKMTGIHSIKIS